MKVAATNAERRDVERMYNRRSVRQLQQLAPFVSIRRLQSSLSRVLLSNLFHTGYVAARRRTAPHPATRGAAPRRAAPRRAGYRPRPVSRWELAVSAANSPAAENQPKKVAEPDIRQILCYFRRQKIRLKSTWAKLFLRRLLVL